MLRRGVKPGQWRLFQRAVKEADGTTHTIKTVENGYEQLKDRAKACFGSLRETPDQPEPEICQEFRQDCREILRSIYSLLARVSLVAHRSDNERIDRMREIGFERGANCEPGGTFLTLRG